MAKTGQVHHIEINVSNWKKSIKLWGWFLKELDYKLAEKWDAGRSYKSDSTLIAFVQVKKEFSAPPYHRKKVGMNHLAFYAKSKLQVDEIIKKLKKKKVPILYENRFPNEKWYAVFFEDPDRIKVELVYDKSA